MDIKTAFTKLQQLNLPLTAVRGKFAYLDGWQKKGITALPPEGEGIGLLLGKISGVWCLDIDTFDPKIRKQLNELIPSKYKFCLRLGNPGKFPSMFFKLTAPYEKARKFQYIGVEILSTGNQTVLPPSIHPDFDQPYTWMKNPIWDCLDQLPEADEELLNKLIELNQKYKQIAKEAEKKGEGNGTGTWQGDTGRCAHNSHNHLSALMLALMYEKKSFPEIMRQLLEEDKKINSVVSYFQCPSRNWIRTAGDAESAKDKILNVTWFIRDAYMRHYNEEDMPKPTVVSSAEREFTTPKLETPENTYKFKQIEPHLTGFAGMLFDYIYNASAVQRSQFAWASSVVTISTLIGNRCSLEGVHPNLFFFLVAPSGYGKNDPMQIPRDLLAASGLQDYLGPEELTSENALLLSLQRHPIKLFSIDEGHGAFSRESARGEQIMNTMAKLYTKGGSHYSGKILASYKQGKEGMGECFSPQINAMFATTQTGFENAIDSYFIKTGAGARFVYFFENEPKRSNAKKRPRKPPPELLEGIKLLAGNDFESSPDNDLRPEIPELVMTSEARAFLDKTIYDYETKKLMADPDSVWGAALGRKNQQLLKFAQIFHASNHPSDFVTTPVSEGTLEAAKLTTDIIYFNMESQLQENISDNLWDWVSNKIKKYVTNKYTKTKEGVPKGDITNNVRPTGCADPVRLRDAVLGELVERRMLQVRDGQFFPGG